MQFTTPEEAAEICADPTQKPELFTLDSGQLPFERMGDAQFELLVADLHRGEFEQGRADWYDTVHRLNDGADQGRDVILFKDGAPVGVIQCKRVKKTVSLDMAILEMCKFFLYAHIRPEIAPKIGMPCRYYIAAADTVNAKLLEFMQGAGVERFDNLRDTFVKKCGAVRAKYETLKQHQALKTLNESELCDLVWLRVPDLKTQLFKKDSLSSLVAKHPTIKGTYFRLESDTAEIIRVIAEYLQSFGGPCAMVEKASLEKIRTEYLQTALCEGDRVNVSLIQGTELIPLLAGMLTPATGTLEQHFGNRPVILAAGAAAVSAAQWEEIDQLVKQYPHSLVLMAGCGEVSGAQLNTWRNADGMTWPDHTWSPAAAQTYKAGWCWVTVPHEEIHKCYVVVENEPRNTDFDHGTVSLRLAFQDVIVWPILDNDFSNPLQNKNSQLRRIIASQNEDLSKRPNLILASLHISDLQDVVGSLADYHARNAYSPIAIATANSYKLHNCEMQLYSATGIFPATEIDHHMRASHPSMQPPGRVMRRSTNGSVTLNFRWGVRPFQLERVAGHRLQAGIITDDLVPLALEFHELFARYPPDANCQVAVKEKIADLNNRVQDGKIKGLKGFTCQTKYGVNPKDGYSVGDLIETGKYVMKAVHALSYLKLHESVDWIAESNAKGHLQFNVNGEAQYHILAWADDNYSSRNMASDLYLWAREATNHPPLIVFAVAKGLVKSSKPSKQHGQDTERFDITAPPRARDSIVDVAMINSVYLFPLNEVEDLYDSASSTSVENFMEDISNRRESLDA